MPWIIYSKLTVTYTEIIKKYTNELLSLSFTKCKFRGLYSNSTIYISRNDEKETWMKT